MSELIPVSKGDEYHEVHPTTLASHKAAGFVECERRVQPDAEPTEKAPRKQKHPKSEA